MPKFVALIMLLASLCGCTAVQDCQYETTNFLRTEWAWLTIVPSPGAQDPTAPPIWGLATDYRHGWKQGYYDVAMGGNGQRPFLPPKKYWSASYQCPHGEQAIEFWYQGYHNGAEAAHQRGAGRFHYLRPYGMTATPCVTPCVGPTCPLPRSEGVAPPVEAQPLPPLPQVIEPPVQPISTEVAQELPSWELMPPSPLPKNAVTEPTGALLMFERPP